MTVIISNSTHRVKLGFCLEFKAFNHRALLHTRCFHLAMMNAPPGDTHFLRHESLGSRRLGMPHVFAECTPAAPGFTAPVGDPVENEATPQDQEPKHLRWWCELT